MSINFSFLSNLLGNDAFISVSVALPIVNAVSVLTMICERGGSVLYNKKRVCQFLTHPLLCFRMVRGPYLVAMMIFTISSTSASFTSPSIFTSAALKLKLSEGVFNL